MSYLSLRESELGSLLSAAFPTHRVRFRTVEPKRITEELILAGPEISIGLCAWHSSGGPIVWSILLIEDDRRSPEVRRLGIEGASEPSGLFATLAHLRETLFDAPHATYCTRGGRLVPSPAPLLIWEVEVEEYDFDASPTYPPLHATHLTEHEPLAAPTAALDTHFDELDALTAGARVLVSDAEGAHPQDLGGIAETEPGRNELIVPCPVALDAGTRLFVARGGIRLPRALRWREREDLDLWRPAALRLDGRAIASRISSRTAEFHFDIPALNSIESAAMLGFVGQLETIAQWLFLPGDGAVFALVPRVGEWPRTGHSHAPWKVSGTLTTPQNLESFLEGE